METNAYVHVLEELILTVFYFSPLSVRFCLVHG
jgi:hypothetical protein